MPSIVSVTDREALKPRRDPYWARLTKGCYVGFRKMTRSTDGTWLARFLDENDGKQRYRSLGSYLEHPPSERYDRAKRDAEGWFAQLGMGGTAELVTVRRACEHYVEHLKQSRGDSAAGDALARFKAYVYPEVRFCRTELAKLTPAHLDAWRRSLRSRPTESGPNRGAQRTDSSLNRDMTCLRAALNLAYRDGLVASDFAWRGKLRPIKAADKRRNDYLTNAQRLALTAVAAGDIKDFLTGLSMLPLRPGALAALTVADFNRTLGTLRIGRDKAGADRTIGLPSNISDFLLALCANKLPGAPIFMRSNGKAWDKDAWKYPVKAAVEAAHLPSSVTAYTLRHSVITDLILAGLDTLSVARLSGTSVLMIERHYGHLTAEQARRALEMLAQR